MTMVVPLTIAAMRVLVQAGARKHGLYIDATGTSIQKLTSFAAKTLRMRRVLMA
jgi:hypothetical protein